MPIDNDKLEKIENQIKQIETRVDYSTQEFTLEVLVNKFEKDDFFVPPYQRNFVWKEDRQSKFIESIFIGIPIPPVFFADTNMGNLEVVDGFQRLSTIYNFVKNKLTLIGLEKLTEFNGLKFDDFLLLRQKKFLNKSIRSITLTDKADAKIRFDIFERINTGSDVLREVEKRRGSLPGAFNDFIREITQNSLFKELLNINEAFLTRREDEELALRFFAFSYNYEGFKHSVSGFLNEYLKSKNKEWDNLSNKELAQIKAEYKQELDNVLNFVKNNFPYGFNKTPTDKRIPRVRFEAIAVGTNLALKENPDIKPNSFEWLESKEFKAHTTSDASNSRPKVTGRINFVRDKLLNR